MTDPFFLEDFLQSARIAFGLFGAVLLAWCILDMIRAL